MTAQAPDDFALDMIDLDPDVATKAFRLMVSHRKNPDLDEYQLLDRLRNNGLEKSANYLHSQI
jgi:hypothetical protein